MTKNRRAKRDARERQQRTGERYVAARRRSAKHERFFEADCCANCLERLPGEVEGLFCSELCKQTCRTVRYWRRVVRDGRIERPDVLEAVQTKVAFILAGGYRETARRLDSGIRAAVWTRDHGVCRSCGEPGEEIDHIDGDSPDLTNLQLLCKECHHAKTVEGMRPATDEQRHKICALYTTRVLPEAPALMADDEIEWQRIWPRLKNERRQRLLTEIVVDLDDHKGASRSEMFDVCDMETPGAGMDNDDYAGYPGNHGGAYGPSSYFAYTMTKDD